MSIKESLSNFFEKSKEINWKQVTAYAIRWIGIIAAGVLIGPTSLSAISALIM